MICLWFMFNWGPYIMSMLLHRLNFQLIKEVFRLIQMIQNIYHRIEYIKLYIQHTSIQLTFPRWKPNFSCEWLKKITHNVYIHQFEQSSRRRQVTSYSKGEKTKRIHFKMQLSIIFAILFVVFAAFIAENEATMMPSMQSFQPLLSIQLKKPMQKKTVVVKQDIASILPVKEENL